MCRQHWRPNHQPQTLSHCMSLDSRARSQRHPFHCQAPNDTLCSPLLQTHGEKHTLLPSPSSATPTDRPTEHGVRRSGGPSLGIPPNNAFRYNMQYLASVFALTFVKLLCLHTIFFSSYTGRKKKHSDVRECKIGSVVVKMLTPKSHNRSVLDYLEPRRNS